MAKVKKEPKKSLSEILREELLAAGKDVSLQVIKSWKKPQYDEAKLWAEAMKQKLKEAPNHVPEFLKDKFDKGIKKFKQTRELTCKLNEQERLAAGDDLAKVMDSINSCEKEKKSITSSYTARLNELKSKADGLHLKVKDRVEVRKVDCEEVWDNNTATVIERRLDTGEVISERKMTADERQRWLFEDEQSNKKAEEAANGAEPENNDEEEAAEV